MLRTVMAAIGYAGRLKNVVIPVLKLLIEPILYQLISYINYDKKIHEEVKQESKDCYKKRYEGIKAG